jgi:hypothetical protein
MEAALAEMTDGNGIPAKEETRVGFVYEDISVERRAQVGLTVALYHGAYGLVTGLARELGASRKFVYGLASEARRAVEQALAPQRPGPKPDGQGIVVDRRQLDRAIVVLGMVGHASQRAIAQCLGLLYEVEPSLGYVNGVLAQASKTAQDRVERWRLALSGAQVQADELFARDQAHLVAVEHRSLLILALRQAERCDADTWHKELTELQARGVELQRLASDGGKALAGAVSRLPGVEHHLDLWHVLRRVGRVGRALEQRAYAAIGKEWEAEKKAKRWDDSVLMGSDMWERFEKARQAATEEIRRHDDFQTLKGWVGEALEAVELSSGRVRSREECLAELRAVTGLMRTLRIEAVSKLADYLDEVGPTLLGYADRLLALMSGLVVELGEEGVRRLCREWRLWRELGKVRGPDRCQRRLAVERARVLALLHWGQRYAEARARVVGLLEGVMRGSSLAECVNSWLRPYADLMKGLKARFLPLFVLYRNSHVFARGKRAGHSPLELAGIETPKGDWLEWLGLGRQPSPRRTVRSLPQPA